MVDPSDLTRSARRMQRAMAGGVLVFLAAGLGLVGAMILRPEPLGEGLARLSGFTTGPLQPWQHLALMGIVLLHLTLWVVLFNTARRMFRNLADGAPDRAARAARQLSHCLWTMLGWGMLSQAIVSVVATWGLPAGERALQLGIGTPEIFVALSALIAGFMARAFALGAALWHDHRAMV